MKTFLEKLGKKITIKLNKTKSNTGMNSWIKDYVNILDSKTMISSNIDDILWFEKNGMKNCQNVLDLGCGGGYISYLISNFVNKKIIGYEYNGAWNDKQFSTEDYYKAFSFVQAFIKKEKSNIDFRFYSKFPLRIKKKSVDGIVLYAVIEHLDKKVQTEVFRELNRILRPGGYIFIAKLPRKFSYQEHLARFLKLGSHSVLYTKQEITNLLNDNGYKIKKIERTGLFLNHPNKITNFFYPFSSRIERFCKKYVPFLNYIAHDYRIVAVKNITNK